MEIILTKPVVAVRRDTRETETLPIGLAIGLDEGLHLACLEIDWKGLHLVLFVEDLLDACSVDDVRRIASL